MRYGLLTFEFSDTMMQKEFNVSKIILQNVPQYYDCTATPAETDFMQCAVTAGALKYELTGTAYETKDVNATSLFASLNIVDFSFLALQTNFGTSIGNTYVALAENSTRTPGGEWTRATSQQAAVQARGFEADSVNPWFNGWNLDMDTGIMEVTFNEPIGNDTMIPTGINFQSAINMGVARNPKIVNLIAENVTALSAHGNTQLIQIGNYNLNRIKALSPLCTTLETTQISFNIPSFGDMQGNYMSLAYLNIYEGRPPKAFVPDTTAPEMRHFDLNMETAQLRMYFTETINTIEFLETEIYIQEFATRSSGTFFQLTSTSITSDANTADVTIDLSEADMNAIKLLDNVVASSKAQTFVVFSASMTRDWSFLQIPVVALIDGNSAANAISFQADGIGPELVSWELDMHSRTVTMIFDEPVRISSFDVTFIRLQNVEDTSSPGLVAANKVALTSASTTTSVNGLTLVIDLCDLDFENLKYASAGFLDIASSYISFEEYNNNNVVVDMIIPGNPLQEVIDGDAVLVSSFTPDLARGSITSFTVSMNTGFVTLTFNEVMDASSLDITKIIFQDVAEKVTCDSNGKCSIPGRTASFDVRLITALTVITDVDATTITFQLGTSNLNAIKIIDGLFDELSASWIAIDQNAVYDVADFVEGALSQNGVFALGQSAALVASSWEADQGEPNLMSFGLNMNTGFITLGFDEPVRASTFDGTGLTIHQLTSGDGAVLNLGTETTTASENGLSLEVELFYDDLNALKYDETLGISLASSYIAGLAITVDDMAGNSLASTDVSNTLLATTYVADTTRPNLLSFDFNPAGNFTFHFDEVIDVTSFDSVHVVIQGKEIGAKPMTLFDTSCTGVNDVTLNCNFGIVDKANFQNVATTTGVTSYSTWLVISSFAFKDVATSPNSVVAIPDGNALQIGPALYSWTIDMDLGLVELRFSEEVDPSTFDATRVIFQDALIRTTSHTLTGYDSIYSRHGGYTVGFYLNPHDLRTIKIRKMLTLLSNSYVCLDTGAIDDVVDISEGWIGPNTNLAVDNGAAMMARIFKADFTRPILDTYILDMNDGLVTLHFDEPVNVESLDASFFTLQSSADNSASTGPNPVYQLQLSNLTKSFSSDNATIVLTLERGGGDGPAFYGDYDLIKYSRDLAIDQASSYLSMISGAVVDMSLEYNPVVGISEDAAMQATSYIADTKKPFLVNFDLDLDAGVLKLYLSEAVYIPQFNVTSISLQSDSVASASSTSHQLTENSTLASITLDRASTHDVVAATVLSIDLSSEDIDVLKEDSLLASSKASTFLFASGDLARDVSPDKNMFEPILSSNAFACTTYVADTTSPTITSWSIDLDAEQFTIIFDETVDPTTFVVSSLTFQWAIFTGTNDAKYTVTSSEIITVSPERVMVFQFSNTDLNNIKMIKPLCTTESNCWLRSSSALIKDMSENPNSVIEIADGGALMAASFVADVTSPALMAFKLETNGKMTLRFTESIDTSTYDGSGLSLQNEDGSASFSLTSTAFVGSSNTLDTVVVIILGSNLASAQSIGVAVTQATSYISSTQFSFQDYSGNYLEPISPIDAMLMGPALLEWSLNMDTGTFDFAFSDPLTGIFDPGALTLYSGQSGTPGADLHSYTLTAWSTAFTVAADLSVSVAISQTDLDEIKSLGFLASTASNTYLSVNTITPWAFNVEAGVIGTPLSVVVIPLQNAKPVTNYVPDSTSPILTLYDIDKSLGILFLEFDEPVDLKYFNVSSVIVQREEARGESSVEFLQLDSSISALATTGTVAQRGSRDVTIQLGAVDLGVVSSKFLGDYLTMISTAAFDMSEPPNYAVAIEDGSALAVRNSVPDTTPPTLDSFEVDINSGLLTFTFSEPVDGSTINIGLIQLQGSTLESATDHYTLTSNSVLSSNDGFQVVLNMAIFQVDLHGIKQAMQNLVFSDEDHSYITIASGAFADYSGNLATVIADGSALKASGYIPDTVKPILLSFDLEIGSSGATDYGILNLHFDEPVNSASIVFASYSLSDFDNISDDTTTLVLDQSSVDTITASTDISVRLHGNDMTTLTGVGYAITASNMYLSVAAGAGSDLSSNVMDAIDHMLLGPILLFTSFSLKFNVESIQFIMSEPIDVSTFDVTGVTIASSTSVSTAQQYTLVDSVLTTATLALTETKVLFLEIGVIDIEELKLLDQLAIDAASTRFVIERKMLSDVATTPNQVVDITIANSRAVDSYTADATGPTLISAALDLTLDTLTFTFNEPISASKLQLDRIILQSHSTAAASVVSVTFQDSNYQGIFTNTNSNIITLDLGFEDMVAIKGSLDLCTDTSNCYMGMGIDAFVDTAKIANSFKAISTASARQIDSVIEDTNPPLLSTFTLDLNTRQIVMSFNEPVMPSSLVPIKLRIQSDRSTTPFSQYIYFHNSTTTSSSNGISLVLDLSQEDFGQIVLQETLAIDINTAFLIHGDDFIQDMNNNRVLVLSDGDGIGASSYVGDSTKPLLTEFHLDMDAGTVRLVFDEPLVLAKTDVQFIAVHNSSENGASSHAMIYESELLSLTPNTDEFTLVLSAGDLNSLKDIENLALDLESTWATLSYGTVTDLSSNPNDFISVNDAFQATSYVKDTTAPTLVSFELNMDVGNLLLVFSETVSVEGVNIGSMRLFNDKVKRFGTVHEIQSMVVSGGVGPVSNVLTLTISNEDLIAMKYKRIGSTIDNTWFTIEEGSVRDMVDLRVEQITENDIEFGLSQGVGSLSPDVTGPNIVRFRHDRVRKNLHIFFDEPVAVTGTGSGIYLTSSLDSSATKVYLTNANVTLSSYDIEVVYDLSGSALSAELEGIASSEEMYLDVLQDAFADIAVVPNGNARQYAIAEEFPECACSVAGTYRSAACDSLYDVVCKPCLKDGSGEYLSAACTLLSNAEYTECSNCWPGSFRSTPCGSTTDTVCSRCATCDLMEYETQACSAGLDRICKSCKTCNFASTAQEVGCNSKSRTWRQENCCFTKTGQQVKCSQVDFANLELATILGRHHWVYPDTSPPIEGYEPGTF
jgi:hypothetical protein